MKNLWLIFSFYILILSVLPCADMYACHATSSQTELQHQANHEHHEQDEDHCSPFCTCACCGISIMQPSMPKFYILSQSAVCIDKKVSFYATSYTKDISSIIWQPPKV